MSENVASLMKTVYDFNNLQNRARVAFAEGDVQLGISLNTQMLNMRRRGTYRRIMFPQVAGTESKYLSSITINQTGDATTTTMTVTSNTGATISVRSLQNRSVPQDYTKDFSYVCESEDPNKLNYASGFTIVTQAMFYDGAYATHLAYTGLQEWTCSRLEEVVSVATNAVVNAAAATSATVAANVSPPCNFGAKLQYIRDTPLLLLFIVVVILTIIALKARGKPQLSAALGILAGIGAAAYLTIGNPCAPKEVNQV
jgi:hypothetical protein